MKSLLLKRFFKNAFLETTANRNQVKIIKVRKIHLKMTGRKQMIKNRQNRLSKLYGFHKNRMNSIETTESLGLNVNANHKTQSPLSSEKKDNSSVLDRNQMRSSNKLLSIRFYEKMKNKIKKLKLYWNSTKRMIPHIFKLTMRAEKETFEFYDLSLKGNLPSNSINLESDLFKMGQEEEEDDEEYVFSDLNGAMNFDLCL